MKKYIKPEIESLTLSTESMLDTVSVVNETNGQNIILDAKGNCDAYASVWGDDDEE